MAKPDFNRVLWFGEAPTPPPRTWRYLGLQPQLRNFRPYGLKMLELATRTTASQEFIRSIGVMVAATPEYLKPLLADYGVAVAPIRDIYEVCDWHFMNGPRGHGDRFTWAAVSGLCQDKGHLLVITEYAQRDGYYRKVDGRQGTFNHELAHCVDAALDYISESPEFVAAWKSDVERIRAKLAPSHQSALSYIIADEPQGPSETFAEIVAAFMGGGCLAYYANDWEDVMPASYAFVQHLLQNLPTKSPANKGS